MNQSIAYETTKIKKSPSDDASKVGSWIIAPSLLGAAFVAGMFGGIAGMATFEGFGFVFSSLIAGGGIGGFAVLVTRILTYDKRPYVIENKTTPIMFEGEEETAPPMGGNKPVNTIVRNENRVEDNGRFHEFTNEQMLAMLTRVENGNMNLARSLGFGTDEYDNVMTIMGELEYWLITKNTMRNGGDKRSASWKNEGRDWLMSRTRGIREIL